MKRRFILGALLGTCLQFGGCAWNGVFNPGLAGIGGAGVAGTNSFLFGGTLPATPNYGTPLVQAGGRP